jgi:hypothetical protein
MIPSIVRWCSETLNPANNMVGSVPGRPITPVVVVISQTPANPRSRITCVASVTSESVTEAVATSKRPSVQVGARGGGYR